LYKVIYNQVLQDNLMSNIVENYLALKVTNKADEKYILFETKLALFITTVFFKHPGFEEEQEWRFMHYCNPLIKQNREIHFNNRKMFLLPYKIFKLDELFPNSIGSPIIEIKVGPQSNSLSRDSIREFLKIKKIDIPVSSSQIPYRI